LTFSVTAPLLLLFTFAVILSFKTGLPVR
jgi:hypothetical protein